MKKTNFANILLLLLIGLVCNAQQIPSRSVPPRLVNDFTNTLSSSQENIHLDLTSQLAHQIRYTLVPSP